MLCAAQLREQKYIATADVTNTMVDNNKLITRHANITSQSTWVYAILVPESTM